MIIGLCGRKQSGKSSMASFIKELLPDISVKEISFAKPLKDFIHEALNVPKKNLYGSNEDKNYPLCTWGEIFQGPALNKYKKHDRHLLSAREILQVIGTDVMRHGHLEYVGIKLENEIKRFLSQKFGAGKMPYEDLWIDLAIMDVKIGKSRGEIDVAVVSDVRFKNEVKAIKKSNGKLVRLYRDTGCSESIEHPSEAEMLSIEDNEFNFIINEEDNKNLKQLKTKTIQILMSLGLLGVGEVIVGEENES